jgi:two-component system sensor histidine kinase BaeS
MLRTLSLKLILAFLAVGLLGIALVAFFAGRTTTQEFGDFVFEGTKEALVDDLQQYYILNGGWQGIEEVFPIFSMQQWKPGMHGGPRNPETLLLIDGDGKVLFPGQGYKIGDEVQKSTIKLGVPIEVDGEQVGTLIAGRNDFLVTPAGQDFLDRVNRLIVYAALGATVVALFLGIFLASTLTRPLRELISATRAVAQGDLEQRVPVRSRDELGELAMAFNQMNANLARSRDLRRQLTADIAHELRTPLSVILGHTEGIKDGVIQPSEESFYIIHDETLRLSDLVEDLRLLSLAEAGELQLSPQSINPEELLGRAAAAQGPRAQQKGITLDVTLEDDLPMVSVDPDRMAQVLGNLLDNAIRYTPQDGRIVLSAAKTSAAAELRIKDSGPGVDAEELSKIFERFYRVDKSRQRDEGGSGLGLAIAKSIVERHGGRLWAESAPGEGMTFVIELPEDKRMDSQPSDGNT